MTRKQPAVRWEGPDTFRSLLVPITDLRIDPKNPRQGDVKRVAASLRRFGQRRLAVVNAADGNLIEAGNHMTLAARDVLGWTHIAVVGFDDDAQTASAYGIAENRTGDVATYDEQLLADVIGDIDDLDGTGWTAEEAEQLTADTTRDDAGEPVDLVPFRRAHILVTCELDEVPDIVDMIEQAAPDCEIRTGAN